MFTAVRIPVTFGQQQWDQINTRPCQFALQFPAKQTRQSPESEPECEYDSVYCLNTGLTIVFTVLQVSEPTLFSCLRSHFLRFAIGLTVVFPKGRPKGKLKFEVKVNKHEYAKTIEKTEDARWRFAQNVYVQSNHLLTWRQAYR